MRVWTWAALDVGGPHRCPVCGSVGSGYGMPGHIAAKHPNAKVVGESVITASEAYGEVVSIMDRHAHPNDKLAAIWAVIARVEGLSGDAATIRPDVGKPIRKPTYLAEPVDVVDPTPEPRPHPLDISPYDPLPFGTMPG